MAASTHPWLTVPPEDYEGHMSDPAVGQLQFLNRIFAQCLERFAPRRLAVIGCATGNGFDGIDGTRVERVVGIDLHPGYLEVARERYQQRLPNLELRCGDVLSMNFPQRAFDLIFCGLVMEYLPLGPALARFAPWLAPGGVLTVVLQLPSGDHASVSPTRYHSLKNLAPVLHLHDPATLSAQARTLGLIYQEGRVEALPSGKRFHIGSYAAHSSALQGHDIAGPEART